MGGVPGSGSAAPDLRRGVGAGCWWMRREWADRERWECDDGAGR